MAFESYYIMEEHLSYKTSEKVLLVYEYHNSCAFLLPTSTDYDARTLPEIVHWMVWKAILRHSFSNAFSAYNILHCDFHHNLFQHFQQKADCDEA